ncbi:MAG: tetratricopeptide repeat protein, partial [bacterium]
TYGEWWRFWEGKPKKEKAKQERVVKKGSKNTKNQTQSLVLSKQDEGTSTDPAQQLLDEAIEFYKKGLWKSESERKGTESLEYYNKAIEKYEELVNKYPDSPLAPTAWDLMASGYARKACYDDIEKRPYYLDKIIECFKKILTDYPNSEEEKLVRYNIGSWYLVGKNYPKAIEYFQVQLSKYPIEGTKTIPTYMKMAVAYRKMGSYTEAISVLQKFKKENPENSWVIYYNADAEIASSYEHLGNFDKALEIYLDIINKADPRLYPRALELDIVVYNIAWIYDEVKKDYINAEIWYKRFLKDYNNTILAGTVTERLDELEELKEQGKLSTGKKKR